jgi:hypothetical protein
MYVQIPIDTAATSDRVAINEATRGQGCQMVSFQTKNANFGNIMEDVGMKMLLYTLVILNILRPFCIFNGHLVILLSFGIFFPALVYCIKKNLATHRADGSKMGF